MSQEPTLLPPNSKPLERSIDATSAARLDALPVFIRHLWDAGLCPPAWLPALAWAFSVDLWRTDWPEAVKRRVIAASPLVHRLKGTVAAVKTAARAIAGASTVHLIEWFQTGGSGRPFTARVEVDMTAAAGSLDTGPDLPRDLIAAVAASANLRSRFDIRLTARPEAGLQTLGLLGPPIVRAIHGGDGRYAPRLASRSRAAAHLRKPLTIARVSMSGALVRPLATAGLRAGANIRMPAVVARVTATGA